MRPAVEGRRLSAEEFVAFTPEKMELVDGAIRGGEGLLLLLGSFARGEARAQSDVDLLIRLGPGRGFSDFMAFCDEAETVLGQRVDVVTEDGLSPYLRDRVLAEAVPL